MRTARYLRQLILPGLAAIAAVAFGGAGAQSGTLAGSGIMFATQAVAASTGGGSVTIGSVAGGSFAGTPVLYTSNTCGVVGPVTFTITFTLPSTTVTFTNNPSAAGTDVGTATAIAMAQVSGGVNNSFISFTGSAPCGTVGDTVTVALGNFNLAGATALASTNTTAFQMTASVSATNGLADSGTKTPNPGGLASSASAIQFTTDPSTAAPLVIDVTAGNLGAKFLQAGADSTVGDQGAIFVEAPPAVNAADTALFTPQSTSNMTLTGSWGGITAPFLLAGAAVQVTSCPTTPPTGAVTGIVTGSAIAFPNVTLPTLGTAQFFEVCLVSGVTPGKGVISSNLTTTASLAASGATIIPGGTAAGLDAYNYNGSVQQLLYSGSGTFLPYLAFVRITNNTSTTANPAVVVQPDTGTSGLDTNISVPGNNNQLISAARIISDSGAVLDSTGRVSMLFLTPGSACTNNAAGQACAVSVSELLVNPGGIVVPLGSGQAP